MAEFKGAHIIRSLRKKWIRYSLFSDLLFTIGFSVLIAVTLNKLFGIPYWSFLLTFSFVLFLLLSLRNPWHIKDITIAQLLNQEFPQLQESSGLLLKEYTSLNVLEQLQRHKTEAVLGAMTAPLPIEKKIKKSLAVLAVLLLVGFVLFKIPFQRNLHNTEININPLRDQPKTGELPPRLAGAALTITPPRYTSVPKREQNQFNLVVEEGSLVNWQLTTSLPAKELKFIFNDSLPVILKPEGASRTSWRFNRTFSTPGFYQLTIDSSLSELYKIEIIRDQPPVIHLQRPEQYTTIEVGEPPQVLTRITITDDYGLHDASISATLSSGSGEAVKFKEQIISLPGFSNGTKQYQSDKLLSLPELGLHPGDELYFFIRATDNHQQEARSDIYIVNLPDTAGLMSLEGLANSMTIKPEYFRSQRQIIIETEQLLKDRDTISPETFNNRSNNLGIDQKMLRLRYGKFLGEENESGEPGGENRKELEDPVNFSNAEKLKEIFTDQHDKAEDATFFEPEIKKQLKATLTEMWNAELPLRVFKPREALPYEYKALRLLKDLQQKTRAYVAKTNAKTTPLDNEKRLTGDLSKIIEPQLQKDFKQQDDPQAILRDVLSVLEQLKTPGSTKKDPVPELHTATIFLNEKAVAQPSLYLPALQAIKRITNALTSGTAIPGDDILLVEKGLQKILTTPNKLPAAGKSGIGHQLSKQYFINLQRRQP